MWGLCSEGLTGEQEFIRTLMDDEIVEEILWNFTPYDFEDLLVQYKALRKIQRRIYILN